MTTYLATLILLLVASPDAELTRRHAVRQAADRWGVDPTLALSVSLAENWSGNPRARSRVGAIGIMQVMPLWLGSEIAVACIDRSGPPWTWHADLRDPAYNACVGVGVLAYYLDRCRGQQHCALVRYNGARTAGSKRRYLTAVQLAARRL